MKKMLFNHNHLKNRSKMSMHSINNRKELIQYIRSWVSHFSGTASEECKSEVQRIDEFWVSYFIELLEKEEYKIYKEKGSLKNEIVDLDSRTIKVPKALYVREYKNRVYKILEENKGEKDPLKLKELQIQIEELTMTFNEENLYKECPNIMSMLTKTKKPNAKEFLRGKYKLDDLGRMQIIDNHKSLSEGEKKKYENILDSNDLDILKEFGDHTLECLFSLTFLYLTKNLLWDSYIVAFFFILYYTTVLNDHNVYKYMIYFI
ncbi:RNA polymerase (mitochondrion) [Silene latifolia]|uniref:RNA polymerase n=1 Tax=Silene latifolia TaxID=37657 RepID=E1AB37_SILLA|nr:RNA polymerase [Silene latifolia]ADK73336.1 RNA polymerase [Silene latifolia]